ncbi:Ribonucleotide-diphosphate reductase (RNR), small subunit, partial [Teratosphaeriaceae sp. CCFEE 6253]
MMSIQTTPSKKAATQLEALKMGSPAKKLCLDPQADKENIDAQYESDEVAVPIKGIPVLDEALEQQAQKPSPEEEVEDDSTEPILRENAQRFVLFPIKYHEIWAMYKKAEASFWT